MQIMPRGPADPETHTAFIRSVDPASARHQLRMSVGVAVVLAVASALGALALGPAKAAEAPVASVSLHQG